MFNPLSITTIKFQILLIKSDKTYSNEHVSELHSSMVYIHGPSLLHLVPGLHDLSQAFIKENNCCQQTQNH